MRGLAVVGVQWGDEGKGKVVHWLSRKARIVARYQGGNNAGHTVVFGGRSYALHTVPSGILIPGKTAVIGNGVVVNPRALREEVRGLERRGVKVKGRLWLSPACHMILPYHILLDTLREEGGRGIGTTKRGIGPCYEDKVARIGIRLCDFLDPPLFKELVERNLRVRAAELSRIRPLKLIRRDVFLGCAGLRSFLKPLVADSSALIEAALARGRRVLFEGAQGAMLDLDFGTYPFVTSSNPTAGAACTGTGVGPTRIGEVLGVFKAYTTRVGRGPFPTEIEDRVGRHIRTTGKEFGTTTGRPRRIGWLDLPQMRTALRVSGVGRLAMMKLDTLADIHPLKVCTAYRVGRRKLAEFPCARRELREAEPVYASLPGFSGDISRARRLRDLPKGARGYVEWVEGRLGLPISIVSVGRSREQTILRDKSFDWA